jgi:3-deoxy-manno-octulosonate cytidylyltransferase (CMP-KDO synthetase)
MDKICIAIPVRYGSQRLPGKPLLLINNKPVIQHTIECVLRSRHIKRDQIWLFTDDTRISEIAKSLDINVIMTSSDPPNAVYRLSRYAHQLPAHFNTIVNLHGDEPMLDHRNLDHLLESYINQEQTPRVPMVLIKHLDVDIAQLKSEVKVVFDLNNNLLYCSRSLVPHQTKQPDGSRNQYYGIVGLHIIYRESLLKYDSKVNAEEGWLYRTEDLEELKYLELGIPLKCVLAPYPVERSLNTELDYVYFCNRM